MIGSNLQSLSLLPSTSTQETLVLGPDGCVEATCESKRGGLFFANESSTFEERGLHETKNGVLLLGSGYAYYGLDSVYFDSALSASRQLIGVVNSTDWWLGSLGLGLELSTMDNDTDGYVPFLSSLVQDNAMIPSHSYGYTAGAIYRLNGVPASLTLGGIDTNRFIPNNLTFSLSSRSAPVVFLNSISVSSDADDGGHPSNWRSYSTTLLESSDADLFAIDSSTPFLWLPGSARDAFAKALNLTYNKTIGLYEYPDSVTSPETLSAWNLTFSFVVSSSAGAPSNLTLTLPYDAFNLQFSYPFPNGNAGKSSARINYFPVRKATDSTFYTLGRAFLQEVYLAVDYERHRFSLSQAVFRADANENLNLLSITRPENSLWPGPGPTAESRLSTGEKVGIGIGGVTGILCGLFAIIVIARRQKTKKVATDSSNTDVRFSTTNSGSSVLELVGDRTYAAEALSDSTVSRFELPTSSSIEMPAGDVPSKFLQGSGLMISRIPDTLNSDAEQAQPGLWSTEILGPEDDSIKAMEASAAFGSR
ncbi:uncharacterized protein Z519_05494 [Cladophialophora bantiana CBS 173.52]|uniref:Peptidase A1 domain-containing protein n=1 Tax=Cladophialophora bantiana (strain ATCC 10958 / CBS 173.52 / CDC B-1940 / NIH 8579) TaxID=1442370 RepID=A0A0D2HLK1_CLAB1|nr:uncharacterized protein Z519_05494 [Cladophialophora bantiana CBS 173.52]KIW94178.1 hypothetical protein Z519_05494 [Cladophialophora bantiana CBS 173.52]